MADINPGDTVETPFLTQDGTIWNSALVVRVQFDRIILTNHDGSNRRAIPNNPARYRVTYRPKPIATSDDLDDLLGGVKI